MRKWLWIFDLDNTLHDATPFIFPQINRAMTRYIETHLGLDEHDASVLRERYWARYGATLLGLMQEHRISPNHFLTATHALENLASTIVFESALRDRLRRIPGRKVVFSNGPQQYAYSILRHTGLLHVFRRVYGIEQVGFRPKPAISGFLRVLAQEKTAPSRAIMVDDSLANLKAAKSIGMRTVWISSGLRASPAADVVLPSAMCIAENLSRIAKL